MPAVVIDTFQAVAVFALAILPGASYTFAYESMAGSFGHNLADRVIRFIVVSAFLHALAAGLTYLLYRRFILTGTAEGGELDWRLVWLAALIYVLIPIGLGVLLGYGRQHRWRWALALMGRAAEPRAWDHFWNRTPNAVLRIRLKSDRWIGGVFSTTEGGAQSYAGGYPAEGDLYLARQLKIDPDSGEVEQNEDRTPKLITPARGLLVRWSEVEYIDIQEF